MKKFLMKCTALLLAVGGLLYVGGLAYKQTNTYRNLERAEETEHYHSMPEEIDIAVFGSSHGRDAFLFFPEGYSSFNFSMGSQSPQYDWMQMREFGERFSSDALVILNLNFTNVFLSDTEENFEKKQERYYRILSVENIVNVDVPRFYLQRLSPLLTVEVTDIAAAFLQPEELILTTQERNGQNIFAAESKETEQARIQKNHIDYNRPSFPVGNAEMLDAYRNILERCKERGWQAVLVTPPYTSAYNACFSQEDLEAFYARVWELSETYSVPYLDYSCDERFVEEWSLFKNIDHLNLTGAEKFDEVFFKDIRTLLVGG